MIDNVIPHPVDSPGECQERQQDVTAGGKGVTAIQNIKSDCPEGGARQHSPLIPASPEAEAGRSPRVHTQPGLHSEFQDRQTGLHNGENLLQKKSEFSDHCPGRWRR